MYIKKIDFRVPNTKSELINWFCKNYIKCDGTKLTKSELLKKSKHELKGWFINHVSKIRERG